jgi:protocatechuate 3,4-dioxygenase beta subunit
MKAAAFLLLGVFSAGQDQTGSVSGTVTDAITHMPVKKTMVTISPNGNFANPVGPQWATTDAAGAYNLTGLQPGKYRLSFQEPHYPQARFGGVSKTVEIKAGEAAGTVNMELIPGAAVSGHITDEDGDALSNCYVQIHPAKNPDQGVQMMGSSGSNQDGDYRAYGIAPGKYILSAQCLNAGFQARPFSPGPDPPISRAYPMQYYSSTLEAKSAQIVEVTAGNEKSGIDFQMNPTPVTQVRGMFSPGGADWRSGTGLIVQLTALTEHGLDRGNSIGAMVDKDKGTFDFRRVFPGSYVLVAFSQGGEENRIGAWQRIDVGDRPLEFALEWKPAVDLTGKVEIESGSNTTSKIAPGQIGIQLLPQVQVGIPASQTQVSDDGTFTLKGVIHAPWRLQVNAPGAFIKAVWLGSTDVTNAPIDLSSGAAGALKIVVSTNTAIIHGSAPAGVVVQAQQIDGDPLFRPSRGTQADQNGQYRFDGVAPGKYRLVVMDQGGPMPDEGGQEVTVREGETVIADLKAPQVP